MYQICSTTTLVAMDKNAINNTFNLHMIQYETTFNSLYFVWTLVGLAFEKTMHT